MSIRQRSRALAVFVLTSMVCVAVTRAETPPAGFTPVFNGKDLSGWHGEATMAGKILGKGVLTGTFRRN